jgi:hypothetical protein
MFRNVHWMFTECSLNVPRMFTDCSLNLHRMFTDCSLSVPWMFIQCCMNVHWLFTECWMNVHWLFTECLPTVHWMSFAQARQVPPRQAADANSQFRDVEGLRVHFKRRRGKAPSPSTTVPWAAALWHGFGANTYSWEMASLDRIADVLGPDSLVITHDAAGFGLTER